MTVFSALWPGQWQEQLESGQADKQTLCNDWTEQEVTIPARATWFPIPHLPCQLMLKIKHGRQGPLAHLHLFLGCALFIVMLTNHIFYQSSAPTTRLNLVHPLCRPADLSSHTILGPFLYPC